MILQFNRRQTASELMTPAIQFQSQGTNNVVPVTSRKDAFMKSLHKMMGR